MELYIELLRNLLLDCDIKTDLPQLIESESYKALKKIKAVLEDDSLDDKECFYRIEQIVDIFEQFGSNCGSRHDFG